MLNNPSESEHIATVSLELYNYNNNFPFEGMKHTHLHNQDSRNRLFQIQLKQDVQCASHATLVLQPQ